jgi:hypothetical protein
VLLGALLLSVGCARPARPLAAVGCCGLLPDCGMRREPAVTAAETRRWGHIDSAPTPAAICLNGVFIGCSPMRHPIGFNSTDQAISLVAVPLYPGRAQQEQLITVPPLPARVSFFMNDAQRQAASQHARPACPLGTPWPAYPPAPATIPADPPPAS